ncbi:PadR family transcriptional regulator [Rhizobium mongolense]|uniref:DNA-binding PadR family transcriptional regulator n=1 Tax=Rhizobium mongolense TaxID=57676 RepID=A0A7W6RQZ9_9HYPH|nr:PadR family transcriptional regulator [Rhizobium mongolense]MBB4276300.1 DNA-binding PadR family transcriptional regulator [Rhizobium mongolense]
MPRTTNNDNFQAASSPRRMLDGDELGFLFLLLLDDGDARHGYDLIREIKTRSGGNYAPSSGIVYPRLALMSDLGQIESRQAQEKRRAYSLTQTGRSFLHEHLDEAQGVLARIEALRFRGSSVAAGPVGRAMQNLKTALGQRLAGTPDKELLLSVAEIIDEAVHKIERL